MEDRRAAHRPVQRGTRRQTAVYHPEHGETGNEYIKPAADRQGDRPARTDRHSPRRRRRHRHGCLVAKRQAQQGSGVVQNRCAMRACWWPSPATGRKCSWIIESQGWDVDYYMTCLYKYGRTHAEWEKAVRVQPRPGARANRLPRGGRFGLYGGEVAFVRGDPPEMLKVVKQCKKPCCVYKLLASGRLTQKQDIAEARFKEFSRTSSPPTRWWSGCGTNIWTSPPSTRST